MWCAQDIIEHDLPVKTYLPLCSWRFGVTGLMGLWLTMVLQRRKDVALHWTLLCKPLRNDGIEPAWGLRDWTPMDVVVIPSMVSPPVESPSWLQQEKGVTPRTHSYISMARNSSKSEESRYWILLFSLQQHVYIFIKSTQIVIVVH